MSTDTPSMSPTVSDEGAQGQRGLLFVGALIAVLGVLAILAPFVTGIGLSLLLGALLVLGGLAHVAHAFSASGWTGSLWQIALAIIYAFAGISLLANPVIGLATLTLLLIFYLAIMGLVEVVGGLLTRSDPRWGWVVVSGVISLLLAGLLWAGFPSTAEWALGLLVGIHLLSTGIMLALVGYFGREGSTTSGGEMPGGELGSG
ncbi:MULTISPECIES: HdeD family acid-resistance protein [Salinibaculum]|uniref:HdeD family acid-resistance protein n=1 Tax=Salinibaculum TaxID=2732368 RepID=UPI0030D0B31E